MSRAGDPAEDIIHDGGDEARTNDTAVESPLR